jgi:hypothetical protein
MPDAHIPAIVRAIDKGLAAGGDDLDFHDPRFAEARDLLGEDGAAMEFRSWSSIRSREMRHADLT